MLSTSYKHITINQLVNLESNDYLGLNGRECARRMKIRRDKVNVYYRLFEEGTSVEEIYAKYTKNKQCCGRKKLILSETKLQTIHERNE